MSTRTDRPTPTEALAYSDLEKLTPYTPRADTAARAAAAVGSTPEALARTIGHQGTSYGVPVPPELLPGVKGLFAAGVSADGTGYLRPVLAYSTDGGTHPTNGSDLHGRPVDPRAVSVQGITQANAGYTVNGKAYTDSLDLGPARWAPNGWTLAPLPYGAGLSESARTKLNAAAPALAAWLLTPDRVNRARLSLAYSTAEHAQRAADVASAVLADAVTRLAYALETVAGR
jgi:hypothetical protein